MDTGANDFRASHDRAARVQLLGSEMLPAVQISLRTRLALPWTLVWVGIEDGRECRLQVGTWLEQRKRHDATDIPMVRGGDHSPFGPFMTSSSSRPGRRSPQPISKRADHPSETVMRVQQIKTCVFVQARDAAALMISQDATQGGEEVRRSSHVTSRQPCPSSLPFTLKACSPCRVEIAPRGFPTPTQVTEHDRDEAPM